jgi:hypothetical protein
MSRSDVQKFVKTSSLLRLETEKYKAATRKLNRKKQELRASLKELLPVGASFGAGDFVVTTIKRRSYRGISEAIVRKSIVEHWDPSNKKIDEMMKSVAKLRKGPIRKHLNVSKTNKTTSVAPADVRPLLQQLGDIERQLQRYATVFQDGVKTLKATVSLFHDPVIRFMGGGADTRNITIALENGMKEKWKLKRQSTRLPITKGSLLAALQQATGADVDEYTDNVIHILESRRKQSVRLTNPSIVRDYTIL